MSLVLYQFLDWFYAIKEINSPRIFLFIFLADNDFLKADLICAFVASSSTSKLLSDWSAEEEVQSKFDNLHPLWRKTFLSYTY